MQKIRGLLRTIILLSVAIGLPLIFAVFLVVTGFITARYILFLTEHQFDPVFKIYVDFDDDLDFNEARALALRMDALANQIEDSGWEPAISEELMNQWALELLPMYSYEGATNRTNIPEVLLPLPWIEGENHNHIGGKSDCITMAVINYRYFNPVSHWYSDERWPIVLAHELAHVQQRSAVCENYSSEQIENTAQMVAWEVMAALANGGNRDAAYALVFELRNVALGSAHAQGNADEYNELLNKVFDKDPNSIARHEKSIRFWSGHPEKLNEILHKYSRQPLDILFTYRNTGVVHQLALPTQHKTLPIDDLLYFIANAEILIEGFL